MAAATDAFKLEVLPLRGILNIKSHFFWVSKEIPLLTQKKCDFILSISLKGKTSSLNASVAAAISLFHLTGN